MQKISVIILDRWYNRYSDQLLAYLYNDGANMVVMILSFKKIKNCSSQKIMKIKHKLRKKLTKVNFQNKRLLCIAHAYGTTIGNKMILSV